MVAYALLPSLYAFRLQTEMRNYLALRWKEKVDCLHCFLESHNVSLRALCISSPMTIAF